MKNFCIAFVLVLMPFLAHSQGDIAEFKDDVPGSLTFDLGFNFFNDAEDTAGISFFGSRTARLTYHYELPILKSGFTFNPGIGFSDERYSFDNNITLVDSVGKSRIEIIDLPTTLQGPNQNLVDVKNSKLSGVYLDIPLELRWHADKENMQRSFKIAVGIRGGILLGGKTKFKYQNQDGDNIKIQTKRSYNLNRFRVGVHGRVGYGSFTFFYFQNLTKLFESDKGPIELDQTIPWQLGITYEIF